MEPKISLFCYYYKQEAPDGAELCTQDVCIVADAKWEGIVVYPYINRIKQIKIRFIKTEIRVTLNLCWDNGFK